MSEAARAAVIQEHCKELKLAAVVREYPALCRQARDGGWAYEANGTYSEPFRTREEARTAAKLAASEQATPGESAHISFEDEKGRWHNEVDSGTDRPRTIVEG